MDSAVHCLSLVMECQSQLIVTNGREAYWSKEISNTVLSARSWCNDQITCLDVRLQCTTCAKSNDCFGTEFDQLFKANSCTWATNTVRADWQLLILIGRIVKSVLPIPLNLFVFFAHFCNDFTSEWVTNCDDCGSNDAWSYFDVWGNIVRVRHDILLPLLNILDIFVELVSKLIIHEIGELFIEDIQPVASQLALR